MKIVLAWLLSIISLSLSAQNATGHPGLLTVHKTYAQGLMNDEYQYLRVDILGTLNGQEEVRGYHTLCISNHKKAYDLKLFLNNSRVNHYQYDITYSICHERDVGDIENNKCERVSAINLVVLQNEKNEVQVNLPRYSLDLLSFAGQYSPCNEADLAEKSFYIKKSSNKKQDILKSLSHQSTIKVEGVSAAKELDELVEQSLHLSDRRFAQIG